jgi:hypothetical protein
MPVKMKCRDYVGKFVVLVRNVKLRNGAEFPAGTTMKVSGTYRGRFDLMLPRKLPSVVSSDGFGQSSMLKIPLSDFELVAERHCRVCGCTDRNCSGCVERTGIPCRWVQEDLCSACAPSGRAK